MATSPKIVEAQQSSGSESRRQQVMVGNLPDDFLRLTPTDDQQQVENDEQVALALQQAQYAKFSQPNIKGRLDITVVEAKLAKNYGVTRMDPYVRLRVGHQIYETHTAYNGAKNPKWNKVIHCFLPQGVDSFHIEIYDECSFTVDELIAWTLFKIPEAALNGETIEELVSLNGKQGDGKEGTILLVVSFTGRPVASAPVAYPVANAAAPMVLVHGVPNYGMVYGGNTPTPVYVQPGVPPTAQHLQQQQQVVINEEDVKQVQEMFPNIEIDVIKAIMETERGNKDRTINSLLQLTNDSN